MPSDDHEENAVFGRNRDSIRIIGDIVSPMPREWFDPEDADQDLF